MQPNLQQPQFHYNEISKFLCAHKSIIIICIDNEKKENDGKL